MPSHAEAVAVTEEVSFTAVPANSPNPSLDNPSSEPSAGKISAAIILKRKMTEIDCAISSSSASITGAAAAMADPPHIDEPIPTSVPTFEGMCIAFVRTNDVTSETVMVTTMTGSDCLPFARIAEIFMPNPSRMTAYWSIFFEVNAMPPLSTSFFLSTRAMHMPKRIANTGPPTTGTSLPRKYDGVAITAQNTMPGTFSFSQVTNFISDLRNVTGTVPESMFIVKLYYLIKTIRITYDIAPSCRIYCRSRCGLFRDESRGTDAYCAAGGKSDNCRSGIILRSPPF